MAESTKEEKELNSEERSTGGEAVQAAVPTTFDFGEKRKKKKKKDETASQAREEIIDGTGKVFVQGDVYAYEELLSRIERMVSQLSHDLSGSKKYIIKPPHVVRVGSKKVAWINFKEICFMMTRNQEHVFQFVLSELGTEGSIAGDGQLVLKGRYGPKHIEALLRKYITEYVTCQMCKSASTTMERDSRTRLFNQKCSACGANRSVTTIKSGFHAFASRERRKAIKTG